MKKCFGMPLLALALASLLFLSGCPSSQVSGEETKPDVIEEPADSGTKPGGVVEKPTPTQTDTEPVVAEPTKGPGPGGSVAELKTIYFEYDKSAVTPDAAETLKGNKQYLLDNPDVRVMIEGHCDERGTNEYNMALGDRRANATRRFLSDLGIDPNRMEVISYGEEKPADMGTGEAAWAKNRRAEFKLAK